MPRGVYDRSKSKEQRAAEKAGAVKTTAPATAKKAAAPKKFSKKALNKAAAEIQAPEALVGKAEGGFIGTTRKHDLTGALRLLTESRAMLNPSNSAQIYKVDNLLGKVIDEYEKQLFPVIEQQVVETKPVEAVAASNGAPVPAPVAAAPVPFNPPTFTPAPAQG